MHQEILPKIRIRRSKEKLFKETTFSTTPKSGRMDVRTIRHGIKMVS